MSEENLWIRLRGCRQNNLKDLSLTLPKHQIIAITGVSGSGKSSLAFDTIFAEGQRRYLEYLSTEARRSIKQMPKPDVDFIEGLSPTLAIGQHRTSLSSRSTVATHTDIYDFLSILYANIGEQHSPITGKRLVRHTRQQMVEAIINDYPSNTRVQLIAPISLAHESLINTVNRLQKMGFIRILVDSVEIDPENIAASDSNQCEVIVDRLEIKDGIRDRLSASIDTALDLSNGILIVQEGRNGPRRHYTEVYLCPETGLSFAPLEPADFNFNSARGVCQYCQGQGGVHKAFIEKFKWDKATPLSTQIFSLLDFFPRKQAALYRNVWEAFCAKRNIADTILPLEVPQDILQEVLFGAESNLVITTTVASKKKKITTRWKGLLSIIDEDLIDKGSKSSFASCSFVDWQECKHCRGARLKSESLSCLIADKNIYHLHQMSIDKLLEEVTSWQFTDTNQRIANEILPEIVSRLEFLQEVGLGYLQLDRQAPTLSEGEKGRVQLASQIGAKLSGILYVLDEPSMGLHVQDIAHLSKVINALRQLENTVIIVEHSKILLQQANHLIELGPGSGIHGGQITFQGNYDAIVDSDNTVSGRWLSGKEALPTPKALRRSGSTLQVGPVTCHNLRDFSVEIPLGVIVGLCGVSGSGKSTLAIDVLAKHLQDTLRYCRPSSLLNGWEALRRLVIIGQQQAGISSRSIPATYIGVMTDIRKLLAQTKLARARGYTASRFVLNKKGGRCEACQGLGTFHVNMQFMPDLLIPCDLCHGKRFNYETLQVTWENASIADILEMSVEDACSFFRNIPQIHEKLVLMEELGLEYLTLGQHFSTLSGGEIQRLKLVANLTHKHNEQTFYIMDEPSAGLHFQDVKKLAKILHRLADAGHSIIMVEHNLDLLQQADHLIELGPGGGPAGGQLIFEGTPKQLVKAKTPTGITIQHR